MVNNYMCNLCQCTNVCDVKKIILKFDEDAKKPLGVDLTIDRCENFKQINPEE